MPFRPDSKAGTLLIPGSKSMLPMLLARCWILGLKKVIRTRGTRTTACPTSSPGLTDAEEPLPDAAGLGPRIPIPTNGFPHYEWPQPSIRTANVIGCYYASAARANFICTLHISPSVIPSGQQIRGL